MATRPSKLPKWNETEVNNVEPEATRQNAGWTITGGVPEKPPVEWHNYMWNLQYKWFAYLDEDSLLSMVSIADMMAIASPANNKVNVLGYYTANDGGGGLFNYDSSIDKSTANGGTIIDESVTLPNQGSGVGFGCWIRQYSGNIDAKWFGVTDGGVTDEVLLQRAIDFIENSLTNAILSGSNIDIELDAGVVHNKGDSGISDLNAKASATFSSVGTDEAMVECNNGLRMSYNRLDLQCDGNANGLVNTSNGFRNHYSNIEIDSFKNDGYGMKVSGSGDQRLSDSLITGEAEVADRGTGIGLHVNTGDFKINDTVIRYAAIPVKVSANTLHATGNHLYNGDSGSATPATDSTNIEIDSGTGASFCHTYLDKGRVVMKDAYGAFFDTKLLFDSTPQHASVFHMDTAIASNSFPNNFVFDGAKSTIPLNDGSMSFLTLTSNGAGSWDAEATSIKDEINLRNFGYPRIVQEETCHVVAPEYSVISKGATQTVIHAVGSNTYADNTINAVNESYSSKEVKYSASGISHIIEGVGTLTTATQIIEGSRTGSSKASSIQTRNRKDASIYDSTNGCAWNLNHIGSTALLIDTFKFAYKAPGTTSETNFFVLDPENSTVRPNADNTINLGTASERWATVYAGTGTINTSDDREKTYIDVLEVEKTVALELKANMKKFKFNDAIELKGVDKARIHFGASAQTVKSIFESHGLVAEDYAMLCYDEWEEEVDEDGIITKEAGNRYGLRYEELLSFIISAM